MASTGVPRAVFDDSAVYDNDDSIRASGHMAIVDNPRLGELEQDLRTHPRVTSLLDDPTVKRAFLGI